MGKTVKKFSAALSVMMIFALLTVGCGKSTPQATSNPSTSQQKSQTSTTAKKEPVKLKYTYWGSTYEKKAMEDALAKFQKKYDWITVEAQHIPSDYETKLTAMVAGNEAPDSGYLRDFMALPWAEEGKLHNIFDFLNKDTELKKEDFIDQAWVYWAPGKAHGVYTALEVYGIYYNKDLFKAANIPDLPTKAEEALTWDKLVEIAKKLTVDQNGKTAADPAFDKTKIKQYGIQFGDFNFGHYMPLVYSAGGEYVKKDGKSIGLTDPKALDAIQKMADLINKHNVAPSPAQAKAIPAAAVGLQTKNVAMIMGGQWLLLDLGQSKVNFGVSPLPNLGKNATSTAQGTTSIFKSTKHPEESYLLWKFLTNPESSIDLYANGLWMPLLKKYYTDPALVAKWADVKPAHPDGYKDAIMKFGMDYAVKQPSAYVKNFTKINAIVQPAIDRVFLGQATAEQALKEVEAKANAEVKGRYDN